LFFFFFEEEEEEELTQLQLLVSCLNGLNGSTPLVGWSKIREELVSSIQSRSFFLISDVFDEIAIHLMHVSSKNVVVALLHTITGAQWIQMLLLGPPCFTLWCSHSMRSLPSAERSS